MSKREPEIYETKPVHKVQIVLTRDLVLGPHKLLSGEYIEVACEDAGGTRMTYAIGKDPIAGDAPTKNYFYPSDAGAVVNEGKALTYKRGYQIPRDAIDWSRFVEPREPLITKVPTALQLMISSKEHLNGKSSHHPPIFSSSGPSSSRHHAEGLEGQQSNGIHRRSRRSGHKK